MKKVLCRSLVLALGVTLVASAALAKNTSQGLANYNRQIVPTVTGDSKDLGALAASAAQGTTVLYTQTFEVGSSCNTASWTNVDLTAQLGTFFHVDDYAGLVGYAPIQGAHSLWCGARPQAVGPLCGYASLPGYGNSWNQAWCTKTCIAVSGTVGIAFKAKFDSEPGYDATTLEYTNDCTGATGWTKLDGGVGVWDGGTGNVLMTIANNYAVAGTSAKIRLHFQSDSAWSDEDGFYNSNGAVSVDSLSAGALAVEDFEGEAVGALSSNDWTNCTPSGYGTYLALFPGTTLVQQDPCAKDLLCVWAAISGSSETYACGGFPAQKAVPKGNANGQYLTNEIWSPNIALTGAGAVVNLQFTVYRDQPLDNLVFYVWHVRSLNPGSCPGAWGDRNFVYYGGQKDWLVNLQAVGDLLDIAGSTHMNVALGVYDMCGAWCGIYGSGACHSHAPLLDSVKVYRVNLLGPQWSIRDLEQFQDSFANDGTLTGTVRADMANDVLPGSDYRILPGDSAVVLSVKDPVSGIADDVSLGGKEIYCYVRVQPSQPAKTGAALCGSSTAQGTFEYAGSQVIGSNTWDKIHLHQCIVNGAPVADRFCVDLNDALFTPGDTVNFFYSATSNAAVTTYASGSALTGSYTTASDAAANAAEFTCLPAGGVKHGGDILYVDDMDGRGAQPFFDTAFQSIGIYNKVDRYDLRAPSSGVSNQLAGRTFNILTQIVGPYRKILWDSGDLSITPGQGNNGASPPVVLAPVKTDDYGLFNTFLNNLTNPGGVYIAGDDAGEQLNGYTSPSAVTFKTTNLTYTLTSANHRPSFGISPKGIHNPAGAFTDDFYIYGGCPLINDFDVMAPTGSTIEQYGYGSVGTTNGAVISQQRTNGLGTTVGVVFSGFSFIYIRDDENDGVSDRAKFMRDMLAFLGNPFGQPTGTKPVGVNSLSQNYPNPFNPQTTIAFSIKERAQVSLKIYNVSGELVRTLADESFAAGAHTKVWNGINDAGQPVASGVYFYKLVTSNFSQTKKMVLLK